MTKTRKPSHRKIAALAATILLSGHAMGGTAVPDVGASDVAAQGCTPLRQDENLMTIHSLASGSGKRCLVQDLVQRNVYDGIDGRNRGSPGRNGALGILHANSLEVDLGGHLVTGAPFDDTTGITVDRRSVSITVRNGVVRSPGPAGIGIGMAPYKDPSQFSAPSPDDERPMTQSRYRSSIPGYVHFDPWDYQPPTHYTIDQMKVYAGGRGVILSGSGNVLRNSTIEVDSGTAAYVYGPNAVIEGNTFIVRRRDAKWGDIEGTTAALKLRDAIGAVIRNNRFVIEGFHLGRAGAAINLIESTGVLLENNVVEGAKQLVRKDAASTVTESGTTVK